MARIKKESEISFQARIVSKITNSLLRDSCGCAMGARFLFLGLVVLIPYYWWRYEHQTISGMAAFLYAFAAIFFISGIGKLAGILVNRALVRRKSFPKKFQTK